MSTVSVGGSEISYDLNEDLRINRGDLNTEFENQARSYAKWAALAITARYAYEEAKLNLSHAEAKADARIRTMAVTASEKLTEAVVSARVQLDPDVNRYEEAVLKSQKEYGLCNVAADAFSQRLAMLRELGQNARLEIGLDPTTWAESKVAKAREVVLAPEPSVKPFRGKV